MVWEWSIKKRAFYLSLPSFLLSVASFSSVVAFKDSHYRRNISEWVTFSLFLCSASHFANLSFHNMDQEKAACVFISKILQAIILAVGGFMMMNQFAFSDKMSGWDFESLQDEYFESWEPKIAVFCMSIIMASLCQQLLGTEKFIGKERRSGTLYVTFEKGYLERLEKWCGDKSQHVQAWCQTKYQDARVWCRLFGKGGEGRKVLLPGLVNARNPYQGKVVSGSAASQSDNPELAIAQENILNQSASASDPPSPIFRRRCCAVS